MINKVENIIGYVFKNKNLLKTALTHSSYANEFGCESYERYEFLGDSLLNFIVAEYLYKNFNFTAGELSKNRSKLVSTDKLSQVINEENLSTYILMGKSLKKPSNNVLADIFESILAAVYLDGGIKSAYSFVNCMLIKNKENVQKIIYNEVDYKTSLQEFVQSLPGKRLAIEFKVINEENIDNVINFTVQLYIGGKLIATQKDLSIKKCEQKCSKIALEILNK